MKKVMVLGGGSCQINLIKELKRQNYYTIVTGYNKNSKGKEYAHKKEIADTFSVKETLRVAKKNNIDALITVGTDQPVYVASKVAKEIGIPFYLKPKAARNVTNKKYMKSIFKRENIPTVDYKIISKGFKNKELDKLKSPFVMKPLDSQGQRGIYLVKDIKEIRKKIDDTLSFSRKKEILVESFYKNQEITISGWVYNKNLEIFSISDRATFQTNDKIGICVGHEYPSKHLKKYKKEIEIITKNIVKSFKIKNGPIYFQYLVGKKGIKVNEIACRIGGAYEDKAIPYLRNIDILSQMIELSLTGKNKKITVDKSKNKFLSTQLFFAKPGKVEYVTPIKEILKDENVLDCFYDVKKEDELEKIKNASQRVGYLMIKGKSERAIQKNIRNVFDKLKILDDKGNNLVIKGKRWYRD
ncbi:MAG: ATP-grasp domain-containing protein [Bacillota bacterium]